MGSPSPAPRTPRRRALLVLEHPGHAHDLGLGLGVALLLNGFADAGQRAGPVPRVDAGCVDEVLEPGPPREALRREEDPLAPDEQRVDARETSGGIARPCTRGPRLRVALGAPLERRHRVVERREVEVGRDVFLRRRDGRTPRVVRRPEDAVVDLAVALGDLLLLPLDDLLQVLQVLPGRVGEGGELEGQELGVRQAQDGEADRLRERPAVDEVGVGEVRVPGEVVVDGVVDAAVVLAAEAEVQAGDAEVVDERGVVAARAERVRGAGPAAGGSPSAPPRTRRRRGLSPAPASRPRPSPRGPRRPARRRSRGASSVWEPDIPR